MYIYYIYKYHYYICQYSISIYGTVLMNIDIYSSVIDMNYIL